MGEGACEYHKTAQKYVQNTAHSNIRKPQTSVKLPEIF